MRLTPLIISPVFRRKSILLIILIVFPVVLLAQNDRETRLGTVLSVELEKEFARNFSGIFEQELRLENNTTGFDRTASTLGLEYSLFSKKVKMGGFYTFIHMYNNDFVFESRNRFYFNLIYKETFEPFTIMWRGRIQSTFRDEDKGSYRVNPRHSLKNKLEVSYEIFGLPVKPFVSCDFSTIIFDPLRDFELTRIRYTGGVNWRLNRTNYMELFLRYDHRTDYRDPNTLALGATYKIRL